MTWLVVTRKQWSKHKEAFELYMPESVMGEAEVIQHNVDWLIQRCYKPDNDVGSRYEGGYSFDGESINWGDLSCVQGEVRGTGRTQGFKVLPQ